MLHSELKPMMKFWIHGYRPIGILHWMRMCVFFVQPKTSTETHRGCQIRTVGVGVARGTMGVNQAWRDLCFRPPCLWDPGASQVTGRDVIYLHVSPWGNVTHPLMCHPPQGNATPLTCYPHGCHPLWFVMPPHRSVTPSDLSPPLICYPTSDLWPSLRLVIPPQRYHPTHTDLPHRCTAREISCWLCLIWKGLSLQMHLPIYKPWWRVLKILHQDQGLQLENGSKVGRTDLIFFAKLDRWLTLPFTAVCNSGAPCKNELECFLQFVAIGSLLTCGGPLFSIKSASPQKQWQRFYFFPTEK